jgi:UDP-N-acetylmuramate: L-alanyl-gamma-D-glutamyl-meso-diaminopimelate ligase
MRVHLIAIGGSAMHNLAIALHLKGITVSGSDDEITDPAKSNLKKYGLLPPEEGWNPLRIVPELDAVILGMHARADNPELVKARQLGLKIYSYPEYLYEQTKDKTRVVIAGSHGKTTITSMVLHVLKLCGKKFDYMVGASVAGFNTSLSLSEDAPIAIFEGDEYLASALDRRPKFLLYKPQIALISGIAWDHVNVFPTYSDYTGQFTAFIKALPKGGTLVYCQDDPELVKLVKDIPEGVTAIPYGLPVLPDGSPGYAVENGKTCLTGPGGSVPLGIFGKHNLTNLNGAREVCKLLGVSEAEFNKSIATFKGAARRLQEAASAESQTVFWDFAHSPSKLLATIEAVKEQYPARKLIACMELHTFSSLTKEFLKEYKGTMNRADYRIVYYNPHTLAHKKLPRLEPEEVKGFFGENVEVFTETAQMLSSIKKINGTNTNVLFMSSGNFDGLDIKIIAQELTS